MRTQNKSAPQAKTTASKKRIAQDEIFDTSDELAEKVEKSQKVECLGIEFENDDKRRKYFAEKLREHLRDPEFRKVEGFPIASDEAILALSDPPYYTACPNPFIASFINHFGKTYNSKQPYHHEPYAVDVSEGKNDDVYQAHSYHTKVPYKAISKYIMNFTEEGDLICDAFCGTGMAGLASQSTDRSALLIDLSPYATFISYFYNHGANTTPITRTWKKLSIAIREKASFAYNVVIDGIGSEIQYAVWSDHYYCPHCNTEFIFWDVAVDGSENIGRVRCPSCDSELGKSELEQVRTFSGEVKRSLVKVYEKRGRKHITRKPHVDDEKIIQRCEEQLKEQRYPTDAIMFKGKRFGDMFVPKQHTGIETVDKFYFPRSLFVASTIATEIAKIPDVETRAFFNWAFLSIQNYVNKKQSYFGGGGGQPGTLTIADIIQEKNVIQVYERKVKKLISLLPKLNRLVRRPTVKSLISTQSATQIVQIPNNSIDYIFTDPPFGRNLMYSELNFINESWLRVFTNNRSEAIVSRSQLKKRPEYFQLMTDAFREYHRILKPGRWITIEFHNSSSVIWNGIQEGLGNAGFIVAQVAVLDKEGLTFKQLASPTGAVSKDLVISAYKPNGGLEERFKLEAGVENGVWDFIRTHLRHLPVLIEKNGQIEIIAERQNYLLFDRMVAFHVQRGVSVPLSSSEFYLGLLSRYPERDSMYFLDEQVIEYDRKKIKSKGIVQLELFVTDEASAIQWLHRELKEKPQTFSDLVPQFMQEISGWEKYEKPLELKELLEQNFLCYSGEDILPPPIHSYLSSNFKEFRNLSKDEPALMAKGKDRWYVPDPNKAGDLEKMREKALLREFWDYLPPDYKPPNPEIFSGQISFFDDRNKKNTPTGRKLKIIRIESVRAGFKHCWQNKDYHTIIAVANRIPEDVLQEDPKLLMWYDQAQTRLGEDV